MIKHKLPHGTLYQALAEEVYPLIPDGSVSMVWSVTVPMRWARARGT